MYTHDGEEIFVIDGHVHLWDATEENIIHDGGEQFIQCFYDYHEAFTPEEEQWDMDTYRKYGKERMMKDLFRDGSVDMGIFQPTYLTDFYDKGFNTTEQNAELTEEYPERFVLNGSFDPREGEEGLEYLEELDETYDLQAVKLYTAEWRGDSEGWRLDSSGSSRSGSTCATTCTRRRSTPVSTRASRSRKLSTRRRTASRRSARSSTRRPVSPGSSTPSTRSGTRG